MFNKWQLLWSWNQFLNLYLRYGVLSYFALFCNSPALSCPILWYVVLTSSSSIFYLIIILNCLWDPTLSFPIAVCFALGQAAAETDTHRVKPSPLPVPVFTVVWQLSQLPTEAKCLRRERIRSQLWIPSRKMSPRKLCFHLSPLKRYNLNPSASQRSHLRWVLRFNSASDQNRLALLVFSLWSVRLNSIRVSKTIFIWS